MYVTAVAYDPDAGWLLGATDHEHLGEIPMTPWPYQRMLVLCGHCELLHELSPSQLTPGRYIYLDPSMSVVPDTGQPASTVPLLIENVSRPTERPSITPLLPLRPPHHRRRKGRRS